MNINPSGMSSFFWPCRMEKFQLKLDSIGEKSCIILDGCHNGDSVNLFLLALKERYSSLNYELLVLFGAGAEKCVGDMLIHVVQHADKVLMVQSRHFKSLSELELISLVTDLDPDLERIASQKIFGFMDGLGPEKEGRKVLHPHSKMVDGTVTERLQWALDYTKRYFCGYS